MYMLQFNPYTGTRTVKSNSSKSNVPFIEYAVRQYHHRLNRRKK